VITTYLQMFAHMQRIVPPPREGLAVVHARHPTVAYYRFLYDAVWRDYNWTSRKKLSDAELAALLHDPQLEVHVLTADGVPAGFAELDKRTESEIELVQFGLMPEFIGQGLGRYFLQWIIDKAWSYGPKRFWLHTSPRFIRLPYRTI
jgi:GNAT superfamily N-acetyltransferase